VAVEILAPVDSELITVIPFNPAYVVNRSNLVGRVLIGVGGTHSQSHSVAAGRCADKAGGPGGGYARVHVVVGDASQQANLAGSIERQNSVVRVVRTAVHRVPHTQMGDQGRADQVIPVEPYRMVALIL